MLMCSMLFSVQDSDKRVAVFRESQPFCTHVKFPSNTTRLSAQSITIDKREITKSKFLNLQGKLSSI